MGWFPSTLKNKALSLASILYGVGIVPYLMLLEAYNTIHSEFFIALNFVQL